MYTIDTIMLDDNVSINYKCPNYIIRNDRIKREPELSLCKTDRMSKSEVYNLLINYIGVQNIVL